MNDHLYKTADFQMMLLLCLLKDAKLWGKISGSLRVDDFGCGPVKFIFEVARNYFGRYGALPGPETLLLLVDSTLKQPDADTTAFVQPGESELLVYILGKYLEYKANESDTAFYESHIANYLATVRWGDALQQGVSATELMGKAAEIKEELNKVHTGGFRMMSASAPIPKEKKSSGMRYGTGVQAIDSRLAGGLMRQQLGLLVAGTGLGKTNFGIAMMANAAWKKQGSLYITLELTGERISERYHAMLAGIPASLFKQDVSYWPACYQKRYAAITSDRFKLKPYAIVADMSNGDYGIPHLDQAIKVWKDQVYASGQDPDVVCVQAFADWAERISPDGLKKITRNTGEERVYNYILEGLHKLCVKHNLALWTAAQAKPESKGKEFLTIRDVAWGGSKCNLTDATLGICPANIEQKLLDTTTGLIGENEDTAAAPECSRQLNISYMKARDTSATDTFVSVYQGPTLRLWQNQAEALRHRDAVEKNPYVGLEDLLTG